MQVLKTKLEGLLIIEPRVFKDDRGFFMETYQTERYGKTGITCQFQQDNLSFSIQSTLRGLHYQYPFEQAKLVQVVRGEVFDVAVDIRVGSPTFGEWEGVWLSASNNRQLFIPEGFAHGFCVTSENAIFGYKCSSIYNPEAEGGIVWNDPNISIDWPVSSPLLSEKDILFQQLSTIPEDRLPKYTSLD